MVRTAGSSGAKTMKAIRSAAIKRIYKHGFEAMRLRDLAADVGIQAGSLYNYITQKQEFLYQLLTEILEELIEDLDQALLNCPKHPKERLKIFVDFHIRWHTARRMEVFIGNMELRSLLPKHYEKVVVMRTSYEDKLTDILEAGNKANIWSVTDTKITTYAFIAMLTGVCNWYRPGGAVSQDELVALYTRLVLDGVSLK